MEANPAQPYATRQEIEGIFGKIDSEKLLEIIELRPTIVDLEAASMWLSGDRDVFGAGDPLRGVASKIVTILTTDENEEPPRAG
jgi:hypothetical protein